jgi:hypothetical protein
MSRKPADVKPELGKKFFEHTLPLLRVGTPIVG